MTRNDDSETGQPSRRRGSGVQIVYDTLRKDILDLSLRPGELLDEATLCRRFGMSRSPIREALVRLTAEGLATTLPNKNTLVASINLEEFPAYIDALDLTQRVTTRLAARQRTEPELENIKRKEAEFLTSLDENDIAGMIETNREFHISISEAAHNRYFHALHVRLMDEGRRMLHLYFHSFQGAIPKGIRGDHDLIIEAIEAGNEKLAERCAHKHVLGVSRRFMSYMAARQTLDIDVLVNTELAAGRAGDRSADRDAGDIAGKRLAGTH